MPGHWPVFWRAVSPEPTLRTLSVSASREGKLASLGSLAYGVGADSLGMSWTQTYCRASAGSNDCRTADVLDVSPVDLK